MLFSSQSNSLTATTDLLQTKSAMSLATSASALSDPIQQNSRTLNSSASSIGDSAIASNTSLRPELLTSHTTGLLSGRLSDRIADHPIFRLTSNSLANATELGTISPSGMSQVGAVSDASRSAVYHFGINGYYQNGSGEFYQTGYDQSSNVMVSLTRLSADADVRVIRDGNHNGIVDSGEVIAASEQINALAESLNIQGLGVGDYYVQVYQAGGGTSFNLNLSANGGSGHAPEPNDTFAQAYDMGTLNGTRIFQEHVQGGYPAPMTFDWAHDPIDVYRFNVGASSRFDLSLSGLSADADVQLYNSSGNLVAQSINYGTAIDSIHLARLAEGDYYVRVNAAFDGSTGYTLNLNVRPVFDLSQTTIDQPVLTRISP
ncbi:PPC domain-containing protein [Phormidesmis priestleyi]